MRSARHWPVRYLWLAVVVGAVASLQPLSAVADAQGSPVITTYPNPVSRPEGITAGPDGALWFTNQGTNSIGRITTAGVITTYTAPSISSPAEITAGPDGNLWFTNYGNNSIGSISTAGVVSNYTGTGINGPSGITAGPDGKLWFTNDGNDSIGSISTTGAVSNYTGTGISGSGGNHGGLRRGPVVHELPQRHDRADHHAGRVARSGWRRLPSAPVAPAGMLIQPG